MAFLMSQVSVAFMLYVMLHLAVSCAAEDNKTAKQTSSTVVCCSVVLHADINFLEESNELACENTQKPQFNQGSAQ